MSSEALRAPLGPVCSTPDAASNVPIQAISHSGELMCLACFPNLTLLVDLATKTPISGPATAASQYNR
jgi:hypothetical protein